MGECEKEMVLDQENNVLLGQRSLVQSKTHKDVNIGDLPLGLNCQVEIQVIDFRNKDVVENNVAENINQNKSIAPGKVKEVGPMGDNDIGREDISEDPFNLYPIIYNERESGAKKVRKEKLVNSDHDAKSKKKGKEQSVEAGLEFGEEANSRYKRVDGVDRRLKRGRKCKSVCLESGIGKVVLDGGTFPSDREIRERNELLIRMEEFDSNEIWKIGNSLGFLGTEEKDGLIDQFKEWDSRDERGEAGRLGDDEQVREMNLLSNADC